MHFQKLKNAVFKNISALKEGLSNDQLGSSITGLYALYSWSQNISKPSSKGHKVWTQQLELVFNI